MNVIDVVEMTCCVVLTCIFSGNDYLNDLTSQAHYTRCVGMCLFNRRSHFMSADGQLTDRRQLFYRLIMHYIPIRTKLIKL